MYPGAYFSQVLMALHNPICDSDALYMMRKALDLSLFLFLGRPEEPRDNHESLDDRGRPQRTRDAHRAMRKHASGHSPEKQQNRCSSPPVPLNIVQSEELLVREQITIDTSQNHTRQRIVLERSACDSLPTTLESDQRKRYEDGPVC